MLIQCWFLFIPAHSHIELRPIVWTIQLTLNLKYSKNAVFEFHHWFQNEDNCLSPQMKTKSQHYVPNWQLSAITFSCSRFLQLWGAQAEMSVQSESQCSISTSKFAFIVSFCFGASSYENNQTIAYQVNQMVIFGIIIEIKPNF